MARTPQILAAGAIVAAGCLAYHNSFHGPLVFDDTAAVLKNPSIRHLWPLGPVLQPPASLGVGGRPMTNLTLALNWALGGADVVGYHICNLAAHLLAGLTLFGIVRRTWLRCRGPAESGVLPAWAVATLWICHPLQTSTVTYISGRAEGIMGLFYLLTLYAFVRYAESKRGRAALWLGCAVLACCLGMASKEVMVTAPMLVLLFDRTFWAGSFREAWRQHRRIYVGLAASWLLLLPLLRGLDQRSVGFATNCPWWAYALTESRVVLGYLHLALWPHPLILDRDTPILRQILPAIPALIVLAALLGGMLVAFRRRPVLGFLGGGFFLILAPTSSVVPVALQPMGENRMYLPLAAVVVLFVLACQAWDGRRSWPIYLALALLLGGLTVERNADYRSALSIWRDTAAKRPGSARVHSSLGSAEWNAGEKAEAMAQFQESVRLDPQYFLGHLNLAKSWSKLGQEPQAIAEYQTALRIEPNSAEAQAGLAATLAQSGRVADAIAEFESALRLQPDYSDAHNDLGLALARAGRWPEAIAHYETALRLDPDFVEAHMNLGVALVALSRRPEAAEQYREALRIDPNFARAHNNLGTVLADDGEWTAAVAEYEAALRLVPDYAHAHYNLGLALTALGHRPEAIAQFESALRLDPGLAPARARLKELQVEP